LGRLFTRQVGNTPPGSSAERGALPGAPRTPLTGCPGGGGPGGGRGPGGGCGPGTALRMPAAPCRAGIAASGGRDATFHMTGPTVHSEIPNESEGGRWHGCGYAR